MPLAPVVVEVPAMVVVEVVEVPTVVAVEVVEKPKG